MSEEKTPQQKWEEDGITCPFCGHEEVYEPCDHLIADFPEVSESGGAVGESWSDSVLTEPARELGLACLDLLKAAWNDGGQEGTESRMQKLEVLTAEDSAPWWAELVKEIQEDENYDEDDEHLGRLATPVVSFVVRDVPGVLLSHGTRDDERTVGIIFLWSADREAATDALQTRVREATQAVHTVTAALA
jgi:hypothetical protein